MAERLRLDENRQESFQQESFEREIEVIADLIKDSGKNHNVIGVYGPHTVIRDVFKEKILAKVLADSQNSSDRLIFAPSSNDPGKELLVEMGSFLQEKKIAEVHKKLKSDFENFYNTQVKSLFPLEKAIKSSLPPVYALVAYFLTVRTGLDNPAIETAIGILTGIGGYFANVFGHDFFARVIVNQFGTHKKKAVELRIADALNRLDQPFLVVLDSLEGLKTDALRDLFITLSRSKKFSNLVFLVLLDRDSVEDQSIQSLIDNLVTNRRYFPDPSRFLLEHYWKQEVVRSLNSTCEGLFREDDVDWK